MIKPVLCILLVILRLGCGGMGVVEKTEYKSTLLDSDEDLV